jgi:rod shape-determining protein MreD
MRKYFIVTIVNIILIFLQESFLVELFGVAFNPNLVIALGFSLVLVDEDDLALFSVLIGGLFLDLLSTGIIGLSSLVLVLLLYMAIQARKTIYRGVFTQLIFVVITAIIYKILANYPPIVYERTLFYSGIYTSVLVLFLRQILLKFKKRYLSSEFRIKA